MAYVFGLILADGALLDVRKSSRTCYIMISNNDKSLLEKVGGAMSSNHTIYTRKSRVVKFSNGKTYFCKENYVIRIGSKKMFLDLLNKGITPRKSLNMKLPEVPDCVFNFFLRGYFDGDGSVYSKVPRGQKSSRVKLVFTSGSLRFLESLSIKLNSILNIPVRNTSNNYKCYQLQYRKKDSLKLLVYMYQQLEATPYLERKYNIYKNIK